MPTWSASTRRSWTPAARARVDHGSGSSGHPRHHGVDERAVQHLDTGLPQRGGEHDGAPVGPLRDRAQTVRPVVDGVHRGDDGEQHLGGADVGRRLVAPDVLFAGLQRESVGGPALRVDGHADQPARQVALEARRHRHVAGVRTAVEERYAEALRGSDHHVGAQLTGRLEESECQQVRRHDELGALGRDVLGELTRVEDPSGGPGVLQEHATHVPSRDALGEIGHDDLDAHRLGAGADHLDGLRQRVGVDHERARRLRAGSAYQGHRLGGSGPLVEQGCVGGRQPGQVTDHRLEVEQRLEPALRDLRLIGRVRRVPARVLEDVASDDRAA